MFFTAVIAVILFMVAGPLSLFFTVPMVIAAAVAKGMQSGRPSPEHRPGAVITGYTPSGRPIWSDRGTIRKEDRL